MDDQEQLRARLEQQRDEVGQTVGQIENRVTPSRVMARGGWRARQRFTDARDRVMGTDDEDGSDGASRSEQALDGARHAAEKAGETPDAMRRKATGNPLAAGLIAFGAGLLAAAALPESRTERRAIRQVEPQLQQVAERAGEQARGAAEELREPAREAAEDVKAAGTEAAQAVKDDANEHAQQAAEDARS